MSPLNDWLKKKVKSKKEAKALYRSPAALEGKEDVKRFEEREFQQDAAYLDQPVSRRNFMKLMGATVALAGASGCSLNFRKPVQHVYPYAKVSPVDVPDQANYFATSMALGEDVVGLLAKSYQGRPVKIEGNPLHTQSLGSTGVFHQSSLLDLYDPDRLQKVSLDKKYRSLVDFKDWLKKLSLAKRSSLGNGLCLLTETQMSPSFHRLVKRFRARFPQAKIFRYDSVNQDNSLHGIHSVTGRWLRPSYRYDQAKLTVSFDADFLGYDAGALLATKQFSQSRDPELNKNSLSRLYVVEPSLTLTGAKADHRYALKFSRLEYLLYQVVSDLLKEKKIYLPSVLTKRVHSLAKSHRQEVDERFVSALLSDIKANKGSVLFVAGPRQPEVVHGLIYLLNLQMSSKKVLSYRSFPFADSSLVKERNLDSIKSFEQHLRSGQVDTLLCFGTNIMQQAPADVDLNSAWKFVKDTVHLTASENELSEHCNWLVPKSHYLEAWGDLVALDGTKSVVQPVIRPLYDSMSDIECLSLLTGSYADGYRLVRATLGVGALAEKTWKKYLHQGYVSSPSRDYKGFSYVDKGFLSQLSKRKSYKKNHYLELAFQGVGSLYDGRFANNGWLQELPDGITKLTWDNAAMIGQKTAAKFNLITGNVVSLRVADRDVELPVFVLPGHVEDAVTLVAGYGRQVAGRVGERKGFDVNPMRALLDFYTVPKSTLVKTSENYQLASTQEHGSMEDRPLYRQASLSDYVKHPSFAKDMVKVENLTSLWPERKYDKGNQWGMAIDLSRCTGCSVCTIACQAENNIPIVGKEEVLNGREMHWIRIDRYFEGEGEAASAVHQPTTCLHCENAPCEQVCPVAATVHGEEGTNDMVYNRCVGTRYCADNCPAKVRRFNFFDYHQRNPQSQVKDKVHFFDYMREPDQTIQMQFNPQVTVRMRGVMEKCSFCIQRIMQGKSDAGNEMREIKDGEVKTACQQACPADAISFGNIIDKNSEVSKKKNAPRDYHILNEIHLKARVSYAASISNPSSQLVAINEESKHDESKH